MSGGDLDPGKYAYVMAEHDEWDAARAVAGPFDVETPEGRHRTEEELVAIGTTEKTTDAWPAIRMVSESRSLPEREDYILDAGTDGDDRARTDGGAQVAEDETCQQRLPWEHVDWSGDAAEVDDTCGNEAEGTFRVIADSVTVDQLRLCPEHREELEDQDIIDEVRQIDDS